MSRKHRERSGYVVTAPKSELDHRELAREIIAHLKRDADDPDCPTLAEFAPRWIEEYAKANRQKPRGIRSKVSVLNVHLLPRWADRRLDTFRDHDIQGLKSALSTHSPKTVNNILTTLNRLLKTAVRWRVIQRMPCSIEFLGTAPTLVRFYDFGEYEHLRACASLIAPKIYAAVLLGGDAGLRAGEIRALEWADIDFKANVLNVTRSESQGIVTLPKSGKGRTISMTEKLFDALCNLRLEFGPRPEGRVLRRDDGSHVSEQTLRTWMARVELAAGFRQALKWRTSTNGAVHILRHTFCSHLAMRGAPALAIQKLAGHSSLRTTERYMHLAPSEGTRAIALLNTRSPSDGNPSATEPTECPRRESNPCYGKNSPTTRNLRGRRRLHSEKKEKETRRGSNRGGLLTAKDVATFLGCDLATVLALVEGNRLAAVWVGNALRFERRALDAFIAKGGAR